MQSQHHLYNNKSSAERCRVDVFLQASLDVTAALLPLTNEIFSIGF